MNFPKEELITFLSCYGMLEWYKYSVFSKSDTQVFLPSIVWRYESELDLNTKKILNDIEVLLDKLSLKLKWVMRRHKNNWIIQPKIIFDWEKNGSFGSGHQMCDFIVNNRPELIPYLISDYEKIISAIKDVVSKC